MSGLLQNLSAIRTQIAKHQKSSVEVIVEGVVKFQPLEKILEAVSAGVSVLGVNYAQEGEALQAKVKGMRWHFIGHVQSRKTRYLPLYDCVESLDRVEVAQTLDSRLGQLKKTLDVLVEVNIGKEPQKSGVLPDVLSEFLSALSALPHLRVKGLMGMPPPVSLEERRTYFRSLYELWTQHQAAGFDTLSMGTSEDYLVAVEEGATLVRLGTALFGPRPVKAKVL